MSNKKTVEPDLYDIPHNYEDGGGIFNGMFKVRNAVEGIVSGGLSAYAALHFMPGSIEFKALTATFIGLPLFILGLFGIGNESVTSFLFYMFIFLKNKRRLVYKRGFINNETSKVSKKDNKQSVKNKQAKKVINK